MSSLEEIPGIGPKTAKKLQEAKIDLNRLASLTPKELSNVLMTSRKSAIRIIQSAKERVFKQFTLETSVDYQNKRDKEVFYVSTGCKELDKLISLNGEGVMSGSIIGLSGPSATGKTQFVYQFCYETIVHHHKYAVWIETEANVFSLHRLKEMAKARNEEFDGEKLIIFPASEIRDPFTQKNAYEFIRNEARKRKLDIGCFAIDSFTARFRRYYGASRELFPERSGILSEHLDFLEQIAKEFNCIVPLTLQVMEVPDVPGSHYAQLRFGTAYVPWGGHSVTHALTLLISLIEEKRGLWRAFLADSSLMPRGEANFVISKKGITDVRKAIIR